MDLPTYTNIWRIEKRLYKLYDFRLPMPLPVGQIAVFLAIAVPYVLVLSLLGLPFSHTLLWVYVLPPGVLAWLTTRPVLEGKRLPELVLSQLRYVLEPRTWCRMAPLAEKDEIIVVCRVWRKAEPETDIAVAATRVPARRERPVARPLAIAPRSASRQVPPGRVAPGNRPEPSRAGRGAVSAGGMSAGGVSAGGRVGPGLAASGRAAQAARGQVSRGRVVQGRVSPGRFAPSWMAQGPEAHEHVAQPSAADAQGPFAPGAAAESAVAQGPVLPGSSAPAADAAGPAPQRSAPQRSAPQWPSASATSVAQGSPAQRPSASGPSASGPSAQRPPEIRPAVGARPPVGPQEAVRSAARVRPVIRGHLAPPAALPSAAESAAGAAVPASRQAPAETRPPTATRPLAATRPAAGVEPPASTASPVADHEPAAYQPAAYQPAVYQRPVEQSPVEQSPVEQRPPGSGRPQDAPPSRPARPVVTVTGDLAAERPLRVVERALRSQPGQRPDGWRDRVVVVPGGHRPGKLDPLQRDRARARLPIDGPRRIVVLGCTRGAGQTTTALLAGDMLASLRAEPVAVLDLNPGRGSLSERAAEIPGLVQDPPDDAGFAAARGLAPADSPLAAPVAVDTQPPDSGLQIITGGAAAHGGADAGRLFGLVAARYRLTLADPAAGCVPRTLDVADQLVIVAPASAEAANALAMTFEWLEAHGHGRLATAAITVLNGVSGPTSSHVEHAANVASGRCRAIVKVPWDSHLRDLSQGRAPARPDAVRDAGPASPTVLGSAEPRGSGLLSPALNQAYTALAGVLVAGLADPGELRSAGG